MAKLKAKGKEQRGRRKDQNLSLRGGAKAISKNEKGVALVMVLVLSAIALAIMAGLIYMLTSGTQISGVQKRYKTASEAGMGGIDIAYQIIGDRIFNAAQLENKYNFLSNFDVTLSNTCLNDKLQKATADWDAACNSSLTIDPSNTNTFDMSFDLGPTYTVYSKIVDTAGLAGTGNPPGNSGPDLGLIKGGVVTPNAGEFYGQSIPYLYTIEVDAENAANPSERAKFSILYQY